MDRQALVKAFARAHLSSASAIGNVPRAMVFPAHYFKYKIINVRKENLNVDKITSKGMVILRTPLNQSPFLCVFVFEVIDINAIF